MTIGKSILSLSEDELRAFIARRREARLVTPKKPPKRKTIKALAKAWNIPEGIVESAVKESLKTLPKGETQCPPQLKKHSKGSTTKT